MQEGESSSSAATVVTYVLGALILVKALSFLKRGKKAPVANLEGKVAVITGASDGIGVYTAKAIAGMGAHTILAIRNESKGKVVVDEIKQQTGNQKVETMQLDLSSLESVRSFAEAYKQKNLPLHLLINNAGIVVMGDYKTTPDGFESQFQVNHLSHFLLTNLLLDVIKASGTARIINVSSNSYKNVSKVEWDNLNGEKVKLPSFMHFYNQSKFFNVVFTHELQRRLDASGHNNVKTHALHPGSLIPTNIFTSNSPFYVKAVTYLGSVLGITKTPDQGSWTTLTAAVEPKYGKEGGLFLNDCKPEEATPISKDPEIGRRLWEVSAKLSGLDQ